MQCLSPSVQNAQRMGRMEDRSKNAIAKPARPSARWKAAQGVGPGRLEVNIVFTDPQVTIGALKAAESLATDLNASIRLRAAIAVPYPLPLEKPPVSVSFTERLLLDLVGHLEEMALKLRLTCICVETGLRLCCGC